jgi:hypothetical protein
LPSTAAGVRHNMYHLFIDLPTVRRVVGAEAGFGIQPPAARRRVQTAEIKFKMMVKDAGGGRGGGEGGGDNIWSREGSEARSANIIELTRR